MRTSTVILVTGLLVSLALWALIQGQPGKDEPRNAHVHAKRIAAEKNATVLDLDEADGLWIGRLRTALRDFNGYSTAAIMNVTESQQSRLTDDLNAASRAQLGRLYREDIPVETQHRHFEILFSSSH